MLNWTKGRFLEGNWSPRFRQTTFSYRRSTCTVSGWCPLRLPSDGLKHMLILLPMFPPRLAFAHCFLPACSSVRTSFGAPSQPYIYCFTVFVWNSTTCVQSSACAEHTRVARKKKGTRQKRELRMAKLIRERPQRHPDNNKNNHVMKINQRSQPPERWMITTYSTGTARIKAWKLLILKQQHHNN